MSPVFSGSFTALVTPFLNTGEIDYDSLEKLIEMQLGPSLCGKSTATDGLVLLETTGEGLAVKYNERQRFLQTVIEITAKKVPVIVGINAGNVEMAIDLAEQATRLKADGLLINTPAYVQPSQEGLYHYFEGIAKKSSLPILLYNTPNRTGVELEFDTIVRLSSLSAIAGLKEEDDDLNKMFALTETCPSHFSLFTGLDSQALYCIKAGGNGLISTASNLYPALMQSLIHMMLDDPNSAVDLHHLLIPLYEALHIESTPAPIKFALSEMGLIKNILRSPLSPLSTDAAIILGRLLDQSLSLTEENHENH
jgi:4-hydroxy-tetrahydrodipicolinate synthase